MENQLNKKQACTGMAVKLFKEELNCAEASLIALARYLQVECSYLPKIASGFGGGIARTQSICGALSGAIMGLGLKFGRTSSTDSREPVYRLAERLLVDFKKEFGTIICRDLTGVDFKNQEEFEKNRPRLHNEVCPHFVEYTVSHAIDLIVESTFV